MRFSLALTLASVGLFGLLMATSPVHAQYDITQPSKEPAVFKAQLLQFTQLTKKNIRDIQALSPDDSSPLDPVVQSCHYAYQLIRAAQWGMNVAVGQQIYKDPVLVLAQKRAEQAWNLSRYPAQSPGNVSRAEWISHSVQDLSKSLRLAQQALMMIP